MTGGVAAVEGVRRIAEEHPALVRTLNPPPEKAIGAAEERLGLLFPPEYRSFVQAFGAVEIGTRAIYGVGSSLDAVHGLNVVWHTEQAREHRRLDPGELVLSSWDDLTLEVARMADHEGNAIDGPVRELLVEGPGERLAGTFPEWVERVIAEVIENASD